MSEFDISVVMPCLNEADTLESCIVKAQDACREAGLSVEIIVADNGSTDGSVEIAERLGVRVVHVAARGYGNALKGGIAAASAELILMGDADSSYDFSMVPAFVSKLREGYDLVQGCRLPSGGGQILPGAMPPSHRWLGNPMFTRLVRWWFRAPVRDVNCGMRAFRRDAYERLDLRSDGMEFAVEMVVKASLLDERIGEIPITLHPDGRRSRGPHLRTIRDGWRTLRFFLLYSPRWLFLVPGSVMVLFGLAAFAIAMPGLTLGGITFDVHTLLVGALCLLLGFQTLLLAVVAKTFAVNEGLLPARGVYAALSDSIRLEIGLIAAAVAMLLGAALIGFAANEWRLTGFGDLDYSRTMRFVVPGVTLIALGFETAFSSFLLSLVDMRRR